jgi:hypothetical protein
LKTSEYIQFKIERLPKGYVFTYEDFLSGVNSKEAVIKSLNRMALSGKIGKLAKGKFYKPESTVFGTLLPDQSQIVKDLLEKDGKLIGYLTGYSIYNKLGLSTQISNTIQIGKNGVRPSFKRDRFKISFVKQKNNITKENIPLLQILDAIRFVKKIPDTTVAASCKRLLTILQKLTRKEKSTITKLAFKYPPSTRALLGALWEQLGEKEQLPLLQKSLNPITAYKLEIPANVLSTSETWNIK